MIILDTSFLVSYYNEGDSNHQSAVKTMEQFQAGVWGRGILLEYVANETMTVTAARCGVEKASLIGRRLMSAQEIEFVPCADLFFETLERFSAQKRFKLSFTDVAILVAAQRRGVTHVATFDADFRKESGVTVVPRAEKTGRR